MGSDIGEQLDESAEAKEKCVQAYNEDFVNNRQDDAWIGNTPGADQLFKLFSSMNSFIGPVYELMTQSQKL